MVREPKQSYQAHLTLIAANWPDPPLCFLCVYWMSATRLMDSR